MTTYSSRESIQCRGRQPPLSMLSNEQDVRQLLIACFDGREAIATEEMQPINQCELALLAIEPYERHEVSAMDTYLTRSGVTSTIENGLVEVLAVTDGAVLPYDSAVSVLASSPPRSFHISG